MTVQTPIILTDADRAIIAAIKDRATICAIAKQVAAETGVKLPDIMGRSRLAYLCRIRELIWFIAHENGASLPQIGRVFNRDHTTILSGLRNEKRRRGEA